MTQEEIELLFKDLAARLPYGVKIEGYNLPCIILNSDWLHFIYTYQEYAIRRPYLRPMSSMTEEEVNEYNELCTCNVPFPGIVEKSVADFMDWLNAHHFDYRGLIDKGLALEAPEGMYN